MTSYNKPSNEINAQLEFVFAPEQEEQPNKRAVRRLAKKAGISYWHAGTALLANSPNGRRDG